MSELTLDVATPERVAVELPIAGIGTRALAWLIDAAVLFGVAMVLFFAWSLFGSDLQKVYAGLSQAARIAAVVGTFLALWGYWTVLEIAWRGQTVGKRVMKIRVVRADGGPVTPLACALRNLLRFVDFLPACYPVGIVCMLVDKRHRRVGDLVAGTVLVREQAIDLDRYAQASATALSDEHLELATGYLARLEQLEPEARLRLGRQLAARLGLAPEQAAALDEAGLRAWLEQQVKGR